MKTIYLNKDIAEKNGLSIGEVLFLLITNIDTNFDIIKNNLINKGYLSTKYNEHYIDIGYRVTNKGNEILDTIAIESDKYQEPVDRLTKLAKELKEIFPKGKKEGTNYYWAEGTALIIRRLKLFFKKYGNTYTDEQIIEAAKKYIQGFNGNYKYMKLLKYFIFKEKIGIGGDVEGDSELVTYIENEGQEDSLNSDWTSTLK